MAITTKITNADRSAVIKRAWCLAYLAAIQAVAPVRTQIGDAMRLAWSQFRHHRVMDGVTEFSEFFTEAYEEQIGRGGRAEARVYLKLIIAKKADTATVEAVDSVPVVVESDEAVPVPAEEKGQLSLLHWIVAEAIRVGEPGLYAVDQVEPVAPTLVMASVKAAPVEQPKPVQLCILDLIAADVPAVVEPEFVGIPETVMSDEDDEATLEQVVIEEVVDPRHDILVRIARNNAAMARLEQDIERDAKIFGSGAVDQMYDRLDDLHTHGLNLRDELGELDHATAPMVPPARLFPSFNANR